MGVKMENFPQTFEPTKSGSILQQFMELRHYVDDRLTEIEQEIVAGDDTKVYVDNVKQEDVYFTSDPQTQITANKNDITSLTTRVGTDETNIETNASDISNLKGRMTTAETNIGTNSNDISNLKGRMTSAESGVTGLENSVVKFTTQSLTAEQQAQARSNIGAGSSTINVVDNLNSTSAFDALSANQGRVLDGKISTNSSAITGLQTSKQDTIDSSHKLSSDLVDDTSATNKFVSSADIQNWNGKQDSLNAGAVLAGTIVQDVNDTVVEYYVSSDSSTWYRKWASGWKECGTKVSSTLNDYTFNFPNITFSNTNYTVVASCEDHGVATTVRPQSQTTNSIGFRGLSGGNYQTWTTLWVYVCGY